MTNAHGIEHMVSKRLNGYPFRLHLVGMLASLRAVQHSLWNHDRKLSETHKQVIDQWWAATSPETLELKFIRTARDSVLKEGSFEAYATSSESSIGESANRQITGYDYDLAYYDEDGKRHDLLAELKKALAWCDRELVAIEAKLREKA